MPRVLGIDIDDGGIWYLPLDEEGVVYQWCCDCGLKHTITYRVVKKGKRRWMKLDWHRDDLGTKLRKFHQRRRKQ